MKNFDVSEYQTTRRILSIACATALAVAFTVSLAQPAHAQVTPPSVPAEIQVPPGNDPFLLGHGIGTQNYVCLPCSSGTQNPVCQPPASGFAWTLFTPQATLFNDFGKQITTHFFSPNPGENGTIRATWEHSRDTSTVWGAVIRSSFNANFVETGAIPWLLVKVDPKTGVRDGPTGGDTLTATTFIQRVKTHLGSAPLNGCAALGDVGKKAFVPYTADYFFYTDHHDTDRR
jgi:hypothetical protein